MPCALCGTNSGVHIRYRANFKIEDLSEKVYSARRVPDRIHYQILRCPRDGMNWSSPVLPSENAAQWYARSSFSYADELEHLTVTYLAALEKVLAILKPQASILEIGCGNGFVLEALYKKGFHQLRGIEPSQDAVPKSAADIRQRIVIDVFREGIFQENSFDLIYFFQTLDHVYDPNALIAECFKLLKPGGSIVAFQHNVESWSARLLGEWSPIIDVEHIYLFSPRTLKAIFEKHGFVIGELYSPVNQISLRHLLCLTPLPKRIKEWFLKARWKWMSCSIRLKLGNLCLVAQKGKGLNQ
jgi:SAM-dependent methyltransferase